MELLLIVLVILVPVGAGVYGLGVRDLIRRGHLHRRQARLRGEENARALAEGRVPCPECAELILPLARRCPHCLQEVVHRP